MTASAYRGTTSRGTTQPKRTPAEVEASNNWFTPPAITEALGPFDLDPAAPSRRHWTARRCFTKDDNGLAQAWDRRAFAFCNPPFTLKAEFARRMVEHGNGILLLPAYTGAKWAQDIIFPHASLLLFVQGRISFIPGPGNEEKGEKRCNFDTMLIAFGQEAACRLRHAVASGALRGTLVKPEPAPVTVEPAATSAAGIAAPQQHPAQPARAAQGGHRGWSHFPVTFRDFRPNAEFPPTRCRAQKKSPSTRLGLKFREESLWVPQTRENP